MTDRDILLRAEPFMAMCGSCDASLPMSCVCPTGDFRPIVAELCREVERLRANPIPPPPTPAEAHETLAAALRLIIASARCDEDGNALRVELQQHGLRLAQALAPLAADFARQAHGERFLDVLAELAEVAELTATQKRVLAETNTEGK